jgi:hypothetical protein
MQSSGGDTEMTSAEPTFTAYAVGLVCASVCTSLSDTQATDLLNRQHPTGIDSPWRIADEPFATGEPNGCRCERNPQTHRHLLFTC